MRVLVCGGRFYRDWQSLTRALDEVHSRYGVDVLIHGAAEGADTLAAAWAQQRGVPVEAYPADWDRYRKRAGYLRNKQMLTEGKPDGVVAFPGGRGTADMVRQARAAGVKVWEPYK